MQQASMNGALSGHAALPWRTRRRATKAFIALALALSCLFAEPSVDCFQQSVERGQCWHIHAEILRPLHGMP
jgi:hypothetical protein